MIPGGSESCNSATTLSMLKGFFDICKCLAAIHLYRQVISIIAHLSFIMQKQQCLITDIVDAINEGIEKITEVQSSECNLPFSSVTIEDSDVKVDAAAINQSAN